MRKWIVLAFALPVLLFGAFYLLTPNTVAINASATVLYSAKAFSRALFNEQTWAGWWPGNKEAQHDASTGFHYRNNTYRIVEKKLSSLQVLVSNGHDSMVTELVFIALASDSISLEWLGNTATAFNPVTRFRKMAWAKKVDADLSTLLQTMQGYYTNADNVYKPAVQKSVVVDSLLISTASTFQTYPTTTAIYGLIDKLEAFAKKKGAKQTGLPMLNITITDDSTFLTRVALPVNKKLADEGDIHYRWMLGGGNILVTNVKGGPHSIAKAFGVLEEYISDFRRVAPAIPFQSLVTDRRAEPDTNKWVTRLFWPVM